MKKLNQKGFTLVEVMVAVSILSVIMVGIMTMMKSMNKSAKDIEKRGDVDQIMTMITQAMQNKATCTATVFRAPSTGVNTVTPIQGIMMVSPNAGTVSLDPRMRVQSLATAPGNKPIINGMALRQVTAAGPVTQYELVITFIKNPAAARGQAMSQQNTMQNVVVRKIPLNLDVCARTFAYGQGSTMPSCPAGQMPVGQTVAVTSSNVGAISPNFIVQACQDCSSTGVAQGCL